MRDDFNSRLSQIFEQTEKLESDLFRTAAKDTFVQLTNFYDEIKAALGASKKVLAIFNGDEKRTEKKLLIAKIREKYAEKDIIIRNIHDIEEEMQIGKLAHIFNIKEVYTVNLCHALNYMFFIDIVTLSGMAIKRKEKIDFDNEKSIEFYDACYLIYKDWHYKDLQFYEVILFIIIYNIYESLNRDKVFKYLSGYNSLLYSLSRKYKNIKIINDFLKIRTIAKAKMAMQIFAHKFNIFCDPDSTPLLSRLICHYWKINCLGHKLEISPDRYDNCNENEFFELCGNASYELANEYGLCLLVRNLFQPLIFEAIIKNLEQQFKFHEAAGIAFLGLYLFRGWRNNFFEQNCAFFLLISDTPPIGFILLCAFFLGAGQPLPNFSIKRLDNTLASLWGNFSWRKLFALLKLNIGVNNPSHKAQCLQEAGFINEAIEFCQNNKFSGKEKFLFNLYLHSGHFNEAHTVLNKHIKLSASTVSLYMEFFLQLGDYDALRALNAEITARKIAVKNYPLLFYWHCSFNKFKEAWKYLSMSPHLRILDKYFPGKTMRCLTLEKDKKILILSECFLGDEIFFSRLYPHLVKLFPQNRCMIACDYRILALMRENFPGLEFLPVHKSREVGLLRDWHNHNSLPGADCIRYLDNESLKICAKSDIIYTIHDIIPVLLEKFTFNSAIPALLPDKKLFLHYNETINHLKKRHNKKFAVGISWRSIISDMKREFNFLSYGLLEKLFEMEDILWIDCQYDALNFNELMIFNNHSKNCHTFSEIDRINDIDSMAAMFANLDLMVSAPNFSADLGASMGIMTFVPVKGKKLMSLAAGDDSARFMLDTYKFVSISDNSSQLINLIHDHLIN